MFFMLSNVIWAGTYAVRWMIVEPSAQLFWLDATYFGVAFNSTFLLIFTLQFTGRSHLLTGRNLILSTIVPFTTLLLLWTDKWHGLFFGGQHSTGTILGGGPWFWFFVLYSYTQIFIVIALFVQAYLRTSSLYRLQTGAILFAACLPVAGNISSFAGFSPFPNLDLTPFIFTASGLIFAYALFGLRLLDVVPIARHKLVDEMTDGVIVLDASKRIVDINPAAERLIGISSSAIGQFYGDVLNKTLHLDQVGDHITASLTDLRISEDPPRDIELQMLPLLDDRQIITGHLLILHDITERKQVEEALLESEKKYRGLIQYSSDPIFAFSPDETYRFVNEAFSRSFGKTPVEIIGKTPHAIFPFEEAEKRLTLVRRVFKTGEKGEIDVKVITNTGEERYYLTLADPIKDEQGKVLYVTCISKNITERKQAEAALRESEERYRAVVEWSPDPIIVHRGGKVIYANPAAIQMFGAKDVNDLAGKPILDRIHPDFHQIVLARVKSIVEEGVSAPLTEMRYLKLDGTPIDVDIQATTIFYDGAQANLAAIRDITERKRAEDELRGIQVELEAAHRELQQSFAQQQQLAHIDDLTGINNHRSLLQLAKREFDVAMRYRPPLSMMFFDIGNFKQINDTFGHAMGDLALIQIIRTVCAKLRSADLIGRYGGDEFVILLPQTTAQDALPLAERIHASITDMRLKTEKGPLTVTISIAIAQPIHPTPQTDTVEDLLHRADQALYAAK